jgi:hypothetical protein
VILENGRVRIWHLFPESGLSIGNVHKIFLEELKCINTICIGKKFWNLRQDRTQAPQFLCTVINNNNTALRQHSSIWPCNDLLYFKTSGT